MAEIDPNQKILERLKTLHQELTFAGHIFQKGSPDQSRPSVQIALGAIQSFLMTAFGPYDAKPLIPLRQLIYALHDLDRGKVVPLVSPQKKRHRPHDSIAKEGFMAFVAASMELFVAGGVPRKNAAGRVANALHTMGYRNRPNKRITAQNVEDWRDRMRSGSPLESAVVARFRRIVSQSRLMYPDLEKAANSVLERLPLVVPPEIPKKPPT